LYIIILLSRFNYNVLNLQKPADATCDEKNGWFNFGVDSKLREILTKEIKKVIMAETKVEEEEQDMEENWSEFVNSGFFL